MLVIFEFEMLNLVCSCNKANDRTVIRQAAGGSPQCLRPGRWLDLYSGTGSVGIEAISRGCSEVQYN